MAWAGMFLSIMAGLSMATAATVDPSVEKALQQEKRVDVLAFLSEQASLKDAPKITVREERIRFVYDQLRKTAEHTQAPVLRWLKSNGLSFQSFHIVNAILVEQASAKDIAKLSELTGVLRITLNGLHEWKEPRARHPKGSEDRAELPSNLIRIDVDRVWNELKVRGQGIVIGVQDSGFDWTHPALMNKYRGWNNGSIRHDYNWHDAIHSQSRIAKLKPKSRTARCPADGAEPCDDQGHGTHVLGTIVGDDGERNQIGVAPEAKWMGCRNMNGGAGTPATYLECFEFFLAPYPKGGDPKIDGDPSLAPHLINNSWACPSNEGCKGGEFLQAVRALHAAGILVVAAAGNEGDSCGSATLSPGNYSGELVSVAAFDKWNKDVAFFSARGPSSFNQGLGPNITAPGTSIRSSVPRWANKSLYDEKDGTSMAAPHVAGAVALLWSARPQLAGQIPETIALIERTASPRKSKQSCQPFPGDQIPNAVWGFGMISAFRMITGQPAVPAADLL